MKRIHIKLIPAVLCLMLAASACTSAQSGNLMSGIKAKPVTESEAAQQQVTKAVTDFSWNLFQQALLEDDNVMISPLSAHVILSLALNGADGKTREEMLSSLSLDGLSVDALNQGIENWLKTLSGKDAKAKWQVANSIWVNKGYDINKSFLETGATYYQADAQTLDFTAPVTLDTINGWVKDKTNGKIEQIISEIKPGVMMYLINAVWFNAEWLQPFKKESTRPGSFQTADGAVEAPFMNQLAPIGTIQSPLGEGIILPYTDERFAFVAILPNAGTTPRELVQQMQMSDLVKMVETQEEKLVQLSLPKIESNYKAELTPMMQAIGMKDAFVEGVADFSKMSGNGEKDLYISSILQKTYIRVDEKGTEAAAATVTEMTTASMPMIDKEMVFDRPFLYAVVDVENGMPLFLGVMENPTK